jgi:hypothetical protein
MTTTSLLSQKNIRLLTLLGIIFMNIGAFLLLLFLYFDYHEFHKISYWSKIEGEIVKVEINELDKWNSNKVKPRHLFAVELEYQYKINDNWYSNKKVYAGNYASNRFETLEEAKQKAAFYSSLSAVTVYYDLDNPSDSVLDPRMVINRRLLIGAFVLIVLGISSSLIFISQRPEKWSHPITR